ncbi:MAG: hypothetical protein ACYST6_16780 [Planctomycetota bacterium]
MKNLCVIGLLLAVSGCTCLMPWCKSPEEWQAQIKSEREAYFEEMGWKVPEKHRELVLKGKVCIGMSVRSVQLAKYCDPSYNGCYFERAYKHSSGRSQWDIKSLDGWILWSFNFDSRGRLESWMQLY